MKIQGNLGISKILKSYSKGVEKASKSSDIKSDRLEISGMAHDIGVARKAFRELPDVREDRVEEIRKLMQSGEYRPSASDIASKILGR